MLKIAPFQIRKTAAALMSTLSLPIPSTVNTASLKLVYGEARLVRPVGETVAVSCLLMQ